MEQTPRHLVNYSTMSQHERRRISTAWRVNDNVSSST